MNRKGTCVLLVLAGAIAQMAALQVNRSSADLTAPQQLFPAGEARLNDQRYTSTGTFEWVSTLTVSLPRTMAATPRRPCDAITTRSQSLD